MENSWRCTFILFLSILSITPHIDYVLTSLNPMLNVVKIIYNRTYQNRHQEYIPAVTQDALLSVTLSIALAGGLIGATSLKILLRHLTRKEVMLTSHGLNIIGVSIVVIGVVPFGSYEAFIVGRFVVGLGIGLGLSVLPLVTGETSVSHQVNFYGGLTGASFTIGSLFGVIVGWSKVFGTMDRYYVVFLVQVIPSVAYIGFSYWIPTTPFQAYIKYGEDEARRVLRILRHETKEEFDDEIRQLQVDSMNINEVECKSEATILEVLRTPQYRHHFIAVLVLFSYVMLCGVNHIFLFSDFIFLSSGLDQQIVTLASIGVFALGVIVSGIGAILINYIEARMLLLFGGFIIIIGQALLTASMATYERIPAMSAVAIVAMCLFYVGFVFLETTALSFAGTLPIDRTRAACTNVGGVLMWFSSWFVGFIATYLQVWLGAYSFLVWLVLTVLCNVYILFFVPNTKGKTSQQIQEFFKSKKRSVKDRNSIAERL